MKHIGQETKHQNIHNILVDEGDNLGALKVLFG